MVAGTLLKCPPLLITVGDNEYLRDEALYFACNFAKNGGTVHLQNYMAMPHVFTIFEKHPSTKTCYRVFGKFIKDVTTGVRLETRMEAVNGKGIIEQCPLNLEKYSIAFSIEELTTRMKAEVTRRYEKLKSQRTQ